MSVEGWLSAKELVPNCGVTSAECIAEDEWGCGDESISVKGDEDDEDEFGG